MTHPIRSFVGAFRAIAVAVIAVTAACSSHGSGSTMLPQQQLMQSVSPGTIVPLPMAKTQPQPASAMSVKPNSSIEPSSWTQIPGDASFITIGSDGSLWALANMPAGPDKYIWHYAGGTWSNIAGLATRL